ncbi:MAG: flagellar biosynthetic protein FliR [Alphaproteobacteria bacterium]
MLSDFLVSELFAFLLVFCRLGTALMVMPGFSEIYVSTRIRLFLALTFSLILAPTIKTLPALPPEIFGLTSLIIAEILTGFLIGTMTRMMISAIHMAGMIIAYQSSLSSAIIPDVTQNQGGQGSVLGNMLAMSAIVIIFASDTHHLMLRGIADSYTLFMPGKMPMVEDFANQASRVMSGAFEMSMKLSAPHLVVGMVLYLGAGVLARLMPNMQIFFIMIAPQLLISFFIFMIVISTLLMWYLDYFRETLGGFLYGG